jgi:hypothetical protein
MIAWSAEMAPLAPAQVVTAGPINVGQYSAVSGNVWSDVVGVLVVRQERFPGTGGLVWVVPQDLVQPFFQFPFLIAVFEPWVTFEWTNGGGAAGFMRANVQALPF